MKFKLTLILILSIISTYGQEKWSYQNDSIYKLKKVKSRKWFTSDRLMATTFYDNEGRMTKFQLEPFVGGGQRTTYFEYDEEGLLKGQVDTTLNGRPDKKALRKMKKLGLDVSSHFKDDKPKVEVSLYKIEYEGEELTRITKYNPDGTRNFVDKFEKNGFVQTRDWYRNGEKYRESVTEFQTEFHKKRYYGWELTQNSGKRTWDYTFEYVIDNGQVQEFTRFENGSKRETTTLIYKDGLLVEATRIAKDRFEYEYYK